MIRLTTEHKWADSKVFYLKDYVGDIRKIDPAKGGYLYVSKDGLYKTGHWSFNHLTTHLRGYYDRETIRKAIKEDNELFMKE